MNISTRAHTHTHTLTQRDTHTRGSIARRKVGKCVGIFVASLYYPYSIFRLNIRNIHSVWRNVCHCNCADDMYVRACIDRYANGFYSIVNSKKLTKKHQQQQQPTIRHTANGNKKHLEQYCECVCMFFNKKTSIE